MESVQLDEIELGSAIRSGELLYMLSLKMGLKERKIDPNQTGMDITIRGQVGERAVAKGLDLYWSGAARTYKAADLSHNIEVRTIAREGLGIKVKETDHDSKRVVGVIVPDANTLVSLLCGVELSILGWAEAGEVKQHGKRIYAHGGHFYVADPGNPIIKPLGELRRIVAVERLARLGEAEA